MVKVNFVLFERDSPVIAYPQSFMMEFKENNLDNLVTFWLKNTDNIVNQSVLNVHCNTNLYLLQRYVYNYLNIPYFKILDIEILFVENKGNNIIINRYPDRKTNFDFQSKIIEHSNHYNILISELTLYVFVLLSTENNNINPFVERYLITEAKNSNQGELKIENRLITYSSASDYFFGIDRKLSYNFTFEEKQPMLRQSSTTRMIRLYEFITEEDEDSSLEFEEKENVKILVPEDKLDQVITQLIFITINEFKLKIKDQYSCSICKCDFEIDDDVAFINKCHHLFHHSCIKTWLVSYNNTCPVCRVSSNVKIYKK